jgi:hypothetical protein
MDKMTTTRTGKYSLLTGVTLLTLSSITFAANDTNSVSIPTLKEAQIFADFTDAMPAVLNYFTPATEAQIISFYQQSYGEAISQERKRGRLTLSYLTKEQTVRVVISQQNNKRQVDVIVEQITK